MFQRLKKKRRGEAFLNSLDLRFIVDEGGLHESSSLLSASFLKCMLDDVFDVFVESCKSRLQLIKVSMPNYKHNHPILRSIDLKMKRYAQNTHAHTHTFS